MPTYHSFPLCNFHDIKSGASSCSSCHLACFTHVASSQTDSTRSKGVSSPSSVKSLLHSFSLQLDRSSHPGGGNPCLTLRLTRADFLCQLVRRLFFTNKQGFEVSATPLPGSTLARLSGLKTSRRLSYAAWIAIESTLSRKAMLCIEMQAQMQMQMNIG